MHEFYSTRIAFKVNRMLLLQYLEIMTFTCTELVTKVLHVFQGPSPTLTTTIESGYDLDNEIKISIPLIQHHCFYLSNCL